MVLKFNKLVKRKIDCYYSTMVISHRGRKTGEKENSIAAFEKAIKMGVEGIECDVRLTSDNKVIIFHDRSVRKIGKKQLISRTSFKDLSGILSADNKLLTLNELFEYIKQKKLPFFLEVKNTSHVLVEELAKKINSENLWEYVHIVGFSLFIRNALRLQSKYPKLQVMQFVNNPLYSFIRLPKKSYGVFLGWIDQWRGSQLLIQKLVSQKRLIKLKELYEKNNFKVMAGVINNEKGLNYFKNARITNIVTDEIALAKKILK